MQEQRKGTLSKKQMRKERAEWSRRAGRRPFTEAPFPSTVPLLHPVDLFIIHKSLKETAVQKSLGDESHDVLLEKKPDEVVGKYLTVQVGGGGKEKKGKEW